MIVRSEETKWRTITGPVADQAALHGVLIRIRDLGLPLLSVLCVEQGKDILDRRVK